MTEGGLTDGADVVIVEVSSSVVLLPYTYHSGWLTADESRCAGVAALVSVYCATGDL